jgi:hypothetical protein
LTGRGFEHVELARRSVKSLTALRGLGGLDGDGFHLDALDWGALLAAATALGGQGGDLLEHAVTGGQLAERGVLFVEEAGFTVADEELATGGVRMRRAGHGDDAASMVFVVEFGGNLVARITGAGHAAGAGLGVGATALDHEALHDAVERRAVVKAVAGEFLEVFDRFGGDFRPERNGNIAVSGGDDGDFVSGGFVAHKGKEHRERDEPRSRTPLTWARAVLPIRHAFANSYWCDGECGPRDGGPH